MKHLDEKYFVPFPEFFVDKDYGVEVYLGFDLLYNSFPMAFNIIFTKSNDLEEIKRVAQEDWEIVQTLNLKPDVKLTVRKIDDKFSNDKPIKSKFKLEFKSGPEGYKFSEKENLITVFVETDNLPDPEKAFFFASDNFPIIFSD